MRALLVTALLSSSLRAQPAPARVTLIVVGAQAARVEQAMKGSRDLPVELVVGRLPAPAPAPADELSSLLSAARQKYVNGEFAACIQLLSRDGLIVDLLAQRRREPAARVAFWQIACRVGSGALPAAEEKAHEFAALGLEVPPDVAAATPEVESLLARGIKQAASASKLVLEVDAALRARVVLDGRPGACVTPCTLDVLPGDHVVALDADGVLPVSRAVQVRAPRTQVKLETTPASPEIAAQQWSTRYGASALVYSEPSTRLLAQAIAARRLVLINVEGDHDLRLRATLATDGTVRAQVERTCTPAGLDAESRKLLRELLVTGKVFEPARPIYKRAAFWVPLALAVAAAVISASVAASLKPTIHTQVGF